MAKGKHPLSPTRLIASGFALVIVLGALLLALPVSARSGRPTEWLTCLFTATSATCVTGLVQVDTAVHWSGFGQGVILCLIQLGGLGFITIISLGWLMLGKRIGLSQRMAMTSALNLPTMAGLVRVVRHALLGTLVLEGAGVLALATRFVPLFGWGRGLWYSLFHSVSAFCNAGFDLMGTQFGPGAGMTPFCSDPAVLITLMTLITVGGLGFFVWEDVLTHRRWSALSLYTRLVMVISGVLVVLGGVFFLCTEWHNPDTLGPMSVGDKVLNALFQSVTLRTAGFSSIDQSALQDSGAFMSSLMMLVGGSSGSTAGGLKTVTVGILFIALWKNLRGSGQVVLRGRAIPARRVMDAMTLTLVVVVLLVCGAMTVSLTDGLPLLECVYETASALGTVGLTMGITAQLSGASSLLIMLFMYLGRVGILSFSMAFLTRRSGDKLRYPTAEFLIG